MEDTVQNVTCEVVSSTSTTLVLVGPRRVHEKMDGVHAVHEGQAASTLRVSRQIADDKPARLRSLSSKAKCEVHKLARPR